MNIPLNLGVLVLALLFHKTRCSDLTMRPYENANPINDGRGTLENILGVTDSLSEAVKHNIQELQEKPLSFSIVKDTSNFGASTDQIVKGFGYPVEKHKITTSDGYILGVYRIPSGINNTETKSKPVVLFLHGLVESSFNFLVNYHAYQNLPLILADEGFDVWMLNIRGTPDSMSHVNLSATEAKFWDFSYDETALLDLPQTIDYILNLTGQKNISFVGHSMGNTNIFALLSKKPEYNANITIVIALAPTVKFSHQRSSISRLYQFYKFLTPASFILGTKGKFLPSIEKFNNIVAHLCAYDAYHRSLCLTIYDALIGLAPKNLNDSQVPYLLANFPASTSTYILIQGGQNTMTDRSQMYDFGKKQNQAIYNMTEPPEYLLDQVTAKVALFSSESDQYAPVEEIAYIRSKLQNLIIDFVIKKKEQFSHFDFAFGQDTYLTVYPEVVKQLKAVNAGL